MYRESYTPHFSNDKKYRVLSFILQETGTYNPMYMRPYVSHITGDSIEAISRKLDAGADLSTDTFAGIGSTILTPDPYSGITVPIPGGWGERRMLFILTVEVTGAITGNKVLYIQGYTDHVGVSIGGYVDPQMRFFINSITTVMRNNVRTESGMQSFDRVIDTTQVINGKLFSDSGYQPTMVYGLRPSDILHGSQTANMSGMIGDLVDTRSRLDTGSVTPRSNRKNNVPTNYLSNITTCYKQALDISEYGGTNMDVYSKAANMTYDTGPSNNEFIRHIEKHTGVIAPTSFTIDIISALDQNAISVTNIVRVSNPQMSSLHTAGNTEHWGGGNRETVIATLLANAVPALMMEYMISKLHFRSTNFDVTGMMNTVFMDARSLSNIDITANLDILKNRIERELMYDITYGNEISYLLEMDCSVFGESNITISLDGQQSITYTTPSFCDSLLAPVYTTSKDALHIMTNDIESILRVVGDHNGGSSGAAVYQNGYNTTV